MEERIIWIIYDDMVSQFAMKYKIEQSYQNCQVISYYTVEDALTSIKKCLEMQIGLPNKLLLDLVLPEMNGWHFLKELEKIQGRIEDLEIYIVSAFSNSMDRKLVKEHPMVMNYFNKPLNKGSVDEMFISGKTGYPFNSL